MAKRATVTQANMCRVIKAASECELRVSQCVMKPAEIQLLFDAVETDPKLSDTPKPEEWPRC